MNELERAARDLTANPSAEPTPVADLERGAGALRRRRRRQRVASVAPIAVALLVVAGVLGSRSATDDRLPTSLDTSTGSVPGSTAPSTAPPSSVDGEGDGETVTVYAASGAIARGLSGDDAASQGLVAPKEVPVRFVPSTAVLTVDALRGKVALFDIAPDTIIVNGMFVDPPPMGTPALPPPVQTPFGEERLGWTLGPNQERPIASARELELLVHYTSCDYQYDIVDPVISAEADVIVITVFGHPPPGPHLTCASQETSIVTVELDEPVGDRRLFDGSLPVAVEVPTG